MPVLLAFIDLLVGSVQDHHEHELEGNQDLVEEKDLNEDEPTELKILALCQQVVDYAAVKEELIALNLEHLQIPNQEMVEKHIVKDVC